VPGETSTPLYPIYRKQWTGLCPDETLGGIKKLNDKYDSSSAAKMLTPQDPLAESEKKRQDEE
jgi:hypothetical protein